MQLFLTGSLLLFRLLAHPPTLPLVFFSSAARRTSGVGPVNDDSLDVATGRRFLQDSGKGSEGAAAGVRRCLRGLRREARLRAGAPRARARGADGSMTHTNDACMHACTRRRFFCLNRKAWKILSVLNKYCHVLLYYYFDSGVCGGGRAGGWGGLMTRWSASHLMEPNGHPAEVVVCVFVFVGTSFLARGKGMLDLTMEGVGGRV